MAIVQATALENQFDGLVPRERVHVLYQAIDSKRYCNQTPEEYDAHRILFLGHMTKAKGYCDIVRAIPKVAERVPDVKFCFGGTLRKGERGVFFNQATGERLTYEDPFEFHDRASSGPYSENYAYLGVLSDNEKIEELKACSFLVLPSYSEGFSRAVLEALTMSKPVVWTPVGAHREVLSDGVHGKQVKPGDTDSLVNAILYLLENPDIRDRIATANARYARENFDIEVITQRLSEKLKDAIHA